MGEFGYLSSLDPDLKNQSIGVGESIIVELEATCRLGSASEIEVSLLELEDRDDKDNLLYNPMNPSSDSRFHTEAWAPLFANGTWPFHKIKTNLLTVMKILMSVDRLSQLKVFW